jgi:putative membrane protein
MKTAWMVMGLLAIAGASGIAAAEGPADPPGQHGAATLDKGDADFMHDAMQGGLAEVKLGRLAVSRAQDEDVRKFAQRMIDDHGKLDTKLDDIARQKGIVVPTDLDKKHQADADKLSQLTGSAFDKAYMSKMVDDHESDLNAFQKEARDGKDADVKAAAAAALPTLEQHLDLAKQIHARLNK